MMQGSGGNPCPTKKLIVIPAKQLTKANDISECPTTTTNVRPKATSEIMERCFNPWAKFARVKKTSLAREKNKINPASTRKKMMMENAS
jgi:hypothetical protein